MWTKENIKNNYTCGSNGNNSCGFALISELIIDVEYADIP